MAIEKLVNSLLGYGVNEKNLDCFKERDSFNMNYNMLRQIWLGLNYVETETSGVPHEILSVMNTSEILSLYRGFGKLIRDGHIKKGRRRTKKEELKSMPIEQVISRMISYGCNHKAMAALTKVGYTQFSTKSRDLAKRIKPLSRQVKDRFMKLLDAPKIKVEDLETKEDYITAISSFMQGLYDRNSQKA